MAEPRDDQRADYAVIGVGSLAEAIVTGLCDGQPDPPRIVLSPRSATRAETLAARYATVTVAADNQSAVSGASTVLLCVRPQDAPEILEGLEFSADHRVVSVMALLTLDDLARLTAPAAEVSRALPSMVVGTRKAVTPLYPGSTAAEVLFGGLGSSLVVGEERLLDAAGVASATVATHFSYLQAISGWLAAQGVDPTDSARYLAAIYAGVGAELDGISDLAPLAAAHATRGGLNERIERSMREAGAFDALTTSLDTLYDSLPSAPAPGGPA